jgi:hypothetical protein
MKKGPNKKKGPRRRNDSAPTGVTNGVTPGSPRRPRTFGARPPKDPAPPPRMPWKSIAAAVLGGGVTAAMGGLVVNQKIMTEQSVGLGLLVGGAATAYLTEGNARIAATAAAGAGAGQLALAYMAKESAKHAQQAQSNNQNNQQQQTQNNQTSPPVANDNATPPPAATPAPAPPPPPPAPAANDNSAPPRKSAYGGGVVVDLFRDAASDLAMLDEDEWRYGMRDEPRDAANGEPIVLDLDEAA